MTTIRAASANIDCITELTLRFHGDKRVPTTGIVLALALFLPSLYATVRLLRTPPPDMAGSTILVLPLIISLLLTLAVAACILRFLRIHFGADYVAMSGNDLTATRSIGRWGRTRRLTRDEITAPRFHGRNCLLDLETTRGRFVIATLGTIDERILLYRKIAAFMTPGDPTLRGWTIRTDPDGVTSMRGPRGDAGLLSGCLVIPPVLWWSLVTGVALTNSGGIHWLAFVIGVVLAVPFLLAMSSRSTIYVRPNRLEKVTRIGPAVWRRSYTDGSLEIRRRTTFVLQFVRPGHEPAVLRSSGDLLELERLARFLSTQTGWRINASL